MTDKDAVALHRSRRRPSGQKLQILGSRVSQYALLAVAVIAFGGPLYWLIISALKPEGEIYQYPPTWIPLNPHVGNFVEAWHSGPFLRYTVNSIVTAGVGTLAEVVIACMCAYAFSYLYFPLKNAIFGILLGALMIPGNITLLPNFLIMSSLNWTNTYAGLIVPGLGSVFVTFLMRQHMRGIPREIIAAAEIDGAGTLRKLFQIVIPLSKPMLVTAAVITFVSKWNEYIWPLVVTRTEDMRTLQVGLVFARSTETGLNWGMLMAATVIVAGPMLIAYFIAQRQIMAGVTQGAIK